jgi:superkiller protein 3
MQKSIRIRRQWISRLTLLFLGAALLSMPAAADWNQALAYYKSGQFEKCLQELTPDLNKNSDWESGHRLAGLCYLSLKNYDLAITELSRAVQLQSKDFVTYRALAQAYFNKNRLDDCINTFNKGESYAKQPADLYELRHLRGAAYYRQQKYDDAIEDLAAAVRIKPDWTDVSALGISYYNQNRFDEAIPTLQRALTLKPGESATSGVLGKAYFKQGVAALSNKQFDQAIDLLRKASGYTPNDGYIYYNIGEACLFSNNYAEAEKSYNQALAILPRNPDIYQRLAYLYEKQKKWSQALASYQKAVDLNPPDNNKADILQRMGMVLESDKRYDEAALRYQKAADLNPPAQMKAGIYQRLATVYENQKKYDQAAAAYQKSIELNPPASAKAEMLYRLGMIWEMQNKPDEALAAYQKASALNSTPALKEAIARIMEQKKK